MEQQFSCLAHDVKDLEREEEAICEQSSRRDFGGHPMHDKQRGYAIDLELEIVIMIYLVKIVPRNDARNGGNDVNMEESFHKRRFDYGEYYDNYNYGG
ncbi:hypothetical protein M9H77_06984 [Catharanthus roseus]|uniref:Uncharacterized protein n=1 Tax=Catharanthus roseus TaxID=4058 RepID=A0ACC0BTV6_CATRO|nr:hypothetical protein M9H77_06984 [Catharanthus roseus]